MRNRVTSLLLVLVGLAAGLVLAPSAVQAAINYFDATKTVSGNGVASCGSGWKLTGGGVYTVPANYYGSSYSDEYSLTGSYPTTSGWKATATRVHGTYYSGSGQWSYSKYTYTPTAYAVCTQ